MTEQLPTSETKKRPAVSFTFLGVALFLTVGGYLAGPWIMTQIMYLQEKSISSNGSASYSIPETRPTLAGGPTETSSGASSGNGGNEMSVDQLEDIFTKRDADQNGKIEGEEISDRLKERMERLDVDKDGAVSKEEFMSLLSDSESTASTESPDKTQSPAATEPPTATEPPAATEPPTSTEPKV